MAFQRGWNRLQNSPHWKPLEEFAKDPLKLEFGFGTKVNSTQREDIRQICKHMSLNFRCVGQGTQKRIVALKLDAIRERKRAEELALDAPRAAAGFYRGIMNILPEAERTKVNGLFVQFYGGERAWSLGEAYNPEKLAEKGIDLQELQEQVAKEGPAQKRPRTEEQAASESDSEDLEALLGRYSSVQGDA
eukprot:TRINITY_DN114713_c0_g1_i1.p1 TRINITY_DN114713_c0_g1~~TRINITY_DN114713_c0_g1_i1.p1  ORF type:complete len:200 (-),score=45.84 TRINITY_DN114713_c0_g1_i1:11-580(-)